MSTTTEDPPELSDADHSRMLSRSQLRKLATEAANLPPDELRRVAKRAGQMASNAKLWQDIATGARLQLDCWRALQRAATESRALDVAEGRLQLEGERLALARDRQQLEVIRTLLAAGARGDHRGAPEQLDGNGWP